MECGGQQGYQPLLLSSWASNAPLQALACLTQAEQGIGPESHRSRLAPRFTPCFLPCRWMLRGTFTNCGRGSARPSRARPQVRRRIEGAQGTSSPNRSPAPYRASAFYVRHGDIATCCAPRQPASSRSPRRAASSPSLTTRITTRITTRATTGSARTSPAWRATRTRCQRDRDREARSFHRAPPEQEQQEIRLLCERRARRPNQALFQMHMALAQMLSEPGREDRRFDFTTIAYHVEHMRDIWRRICTATSPRLPPRRSSKG